MSYISGLYKLACARSPVKTTMARVRRGGRPKLTDEQVLQIRRRCKPGERGKIQVLAREYGVLPFTIWSIVNYAYRSHPFNPLDPENIRAAA